MIKACLFDLDGVIVDTARYHFLAWQRLAVELGIRFTERDNERLKGVSRMTSLEILLSLGGAGELFSLRQKEELAARKNDWYGEYIGRMTPADVLPGVDGFLRDLRSEGVGIALGSSSRNAGTILDRTGIRPLFDAVVDGNLVTNAKPDPEVFLTGASLLGADPGGCVVFEDAAAGIEAARRAGMRSVGVGDPAMLGDATIVIGSFDGFTVDDLRWLIREQVGKCV